tara:strand:- start:19 stop:696 length:678 start_codon:yes stop_codon:yes gene_type:complete
MPKNKGKGGKKFKKFKKGNNDKRDFVCKMEHEYHGQMYAKVTKMLGNGRLRAICDDGKTRLCSIRGKLRKRKGSNMISVEDIILVCIRPFNTDLADVLHKYNHEERQEFIKGRVDVTLTFNNILNNINTSTNDAIIFTNDLDIIINSEDEAYSDTYDDLELEDNNNKAISYESEEESNNVPEKKKNWKDKREKSLDKRDRRKNNWKDNYQGYNQKDNSDNFVNDI